MVNPIKPAPAAAETHFDRASWAVLLGVLALAALMVSSTLAVLRRPADGWLIPYDTDPPYLDYFYGDWPTPLQAGDVLVAVDERPLGMMFSLDQTVAGPQGWHAGDTVVYTLVRQGETLQVPVQLHAPTWPQVLRAIGRTAGRDYGEWSWALIALVVFGRRPRSRAARLMLSAFVSHTAVTKIGWATTTVSLYTAPAALVLLVQFVTNFWLWLFWPAVIWLVLSFPQPVWPLTRWPRRLPALLFGVPLLTLPFTLLTGISAPALATLIIELLLLLLALLLAALTAYRPGADPVARAQANWVLLGVGISQGLVLTFYLLQYYFPVIRQLPSESDLAFEVALPICLAIAILRYRLFDINVIIRRTLLYAGLTAILGLVYFGLVVVLESALRPFTGSGESQGAVVLSTLAIAALFGPLRRRVQTFIDRRFDRRRYNAAQTLAAFGAEARSETDLAALQAHLERVVDETMRPASVQVWFGPERP